MTVLSKSSDLSLPDSLYGFSKLSDYLNWKEWSVAKITGGLILGGSILYCGHIWNSHKFFERRGIPTPKYTFIAGNFGEVIDEGYSACLKKWTETYGKTYGIYEGHIPMLVTTDLDIIQEAFIKKFSHFSARKLGPFQASDQQPEQDLFGSSKDRWKRMRTLMNPTFTTSKIKILLPLMQKCSNRLLEEIAKSTDREININNLLDCLTMDTIFNCAFGIDLDAQKNPSNAFLVEGIRFFRERAEFNFSLKLSLYFPEFKPLLRSLGQMWSYVGTKINDKYVLPIFSLMNKIHQILDKRLESKVQRQDYLQILLEAYDESLEETSSKEGAIDISTLKVEKKITSDEIKANLVLFLLAGFETTASSLSYCMYVMARYPAEMRKLQEEIDTHFGGLQSGETIQPDYDNIQKLQYMDMFVKEVLRFYPIATGAVNRRCIESTNIKGIDIPKNTVIAVDVESLHNDPKYWLSPDEFNPMRFHPDNKINPLVYIPFGIGPRICIGMRFAMVEIKMTLAKVLSKYDVLPTVNTPEKLTFAEGVVRRVKNGIPIEIRARENK